MSTYYIRIGKNISMPRPALKDYKQPDWSQEKQSWKQVTLDCEQLLSYYTAFNNSVYQVEWQKDCCGFTQQAAQHYIAFFSLTPSPIPPPNVTGDRIGKKKKVELLGWDKNYFLRQKRKREIITVITIYAYIYKTRDAQYNCMPSVNRWSASL